MHGNSVYDEILAAANKLVSAESVPAEIPKEVLRHKAITVAKRGYRFSPTSLDALAAYMQGYALLLSGDVGTGKTLFFTVVKPDIVSVSLLELSAYKLDDITSRIDSMCDDELVIDDIGNEPIYNNYGCKMDLLPWIIERRMRSHHRTHYTTNLAGNDLVSRYGDRVVDRLHEMCKAFAFKGVSQRHTKINAKAAYRKYSWALCTERLCKFCDGSSCAKGVAVPPDKQERPDRPENCPWYKNINAEFEF